MIRALLSNLQSVVNSIFNLKPASVYMRAATRSLALALSAAMIGSSVAQPVQAAMAASPQLPEFVRTLTPPSRLGYLENYFQGETKKPVILIQDLHCNYGVQKKIVGLLRYLQPKVALGDKPMVVGVEATWKDEDFSYTRPYDLKIREKAGDVLMKLAELKGTEHFAMTSEKPVRLAGIDDEKHYLVHRTLVRKSADIRLRLAHKLDELQAVLAESKDKAPRSIRKLWKVEEKFEKGEMGLLELARELGVEKIANYGEAESLLLRKKVELAQQSKGEKAVFLSNLVKAEQEFHLLARLFRQQLTLEEVKFVGKQLPEILTWINALMPGQNKEEWQEAIRSAIDYYALALLRDKPLAENTIRLSQKNAASSVIAVTGGFHTDGIAKILREKKVSYVVIAPVVESHTIKDEVLYLERMLGIHVTKQEMAEAFGQDRGIATAHTIDPGPANEGIVKDGILTAHLLASDANRLRSPLIRPYDRMPLTPVERMLESLDKKALFVSGVSFEQLYELLHKGIAFEYRIPGRAPGIIRTVSQLEDSVKMSYRYGTSQDTIAPQLTMSKSIDSAGNVQYVVYDVSNLVSQKPSMGYLPPMYLADFDATAAIEDGLGAIGVTGMEGVRSQHGERVIVVDELREQGIRGIRVVLSRHIEPTAITRREGDFLVVYVRPEFLLLDSAQQLAIAAREAINIRDWGKVDPKMETLKEAERRTMKELVRSIVLHRDEAKGVTLMAFQRAGETLGPGFADFRDLFRAVLGLRGVAIGGVEGLSALDASGPLFEQELTNYISHIFGHHSPFADQEDQLVEQTGIYMAHELTPGEPGVTREQVAEIAAEKLTVNVSEQVKGYAIDVAHMAAQGAQSLEEAVAAVLPKGHPHEELVDQVRAQAEVLLSA